MTKAGGGDGRGKRQDLRVTRVRKIGTPNRLFFRIFFQTGSEQVLEAYLVWSQFRCMKACGFHGYLVPPNRKVGYKGMN